MSGATVTVWEAGTSYGSGATQLASTTSAADGSFAFPVNSYTCDYANAPVYITASGGNPGGGQNANLVLAAGLGTCSTAPSAVVLINEVTTAATAYALSGFFNTTLGGDYTTDTIGGQAAGSGVYNAGLVLANNYTIPNLVNLRTGLVNPNTATTTVEAAKIYSIANVIASCVNSQGETSTTETASNCGQLFSDTTPPGGTRPADTLQAAVQMALYPYQNVVALYNLSSSTPPFFGLTSAPADWTVGVSYTSPNFGLAINATAAGPTSSSLDIDANGDVWFPTNTASSHGLGSFNPATETFSGPYATQVAHPQYVAIDLAGNAWTTDLNGSALVSTSVNSPSAIGNAVTVTNSIGGGPLSIDQDGSTVLFAYNTGTAVVSAAESQGTVHTVYQFSGLPTGLTTDYYDEYYLTSYNNASLAVIPLGSNSCDLEYSAIYGGQGGGGEDYDANSTPVSYSPCSYTGGAAQAYSSLDAVFSLTSQNALAEFDSAQSFVPAVALNLPEGIATDGIGNEWIANSGNASVSTLGYYPQNGDSTDFYETSPIAYVHDANNGNTMTKPFGIAVDASGNVWISNASCVATSLSCTATSFTLSELVGAAAPTVTPLSAQGINAGFEPSVVHKSYTRQGMRRTIRR